ncbi:MAG: hypothetical protein QM802_22750 [Agriterribacter sp.]
MMKVISLNLFRAGIAIASLYLIGCSTATANNSKNNEPDSIPPIRRIPPQTRIIILPEVDLTNAVNSKDSIYIACRIPIPATAALFVRNDSLHQSIVAAEALTISAKKSISKVPFHFDTSQWIFWKINSIDYIKKWGIAPRQASIELRISSDSGDIWGGEFGTFRARDLTRVFRSTTNPAPASLKKGSMQFDYRVDADADIKIEILPLDIEEAQAFFTDKKTDIQSGQRSYKWNFLMNDGKKILPGAYYARFRCIARNSLEPVNDVCIPFNAVD